MAVDLAPRVPIRRRTNRLPVSCGTCSAYLHIAVPTSDRNAGSLL